MHCQTTVLLAFATAALATATPQGYSYSSYGTVDCETQNNECKAGPDANMATCAAMYASCLGYNPYESSSSSVPLPPQTVKPVPPMSSSSAPPPAKPTNTSAPPAGTTKQPVAGMTTSAPPIGPVKSVPSAGMSMPPVGHNITYTTEVVTAYTTYCPASTMITFNQETYTVHSATTLTITNCPCTITKPVENKPGPTATPFVPVPVPPSTGGVPHGSVGTITPPSPTPVKPTESQFTGAAAAVQKPIAGVLAFFGAVALL